VALADGLRLEAAEAVRLLKQAGTKRLVMLTGDRYRRTADSRAGQISEYRAELLQEASGGL